MATHRTLARFAGVAVALVGGAAVITGCGGSATPVISNVADAGATSASGGGAATGTSGGGSGTVNWEWQLPTSWDPVTSTAGNDVHALSLTYASLTRLDAKGDAGPGLAQSWKYSDGGKQLTFTLRSGLKFPDGSALTSQLVKQNIERGLHQDNSTIASELAVIKGVKIKNATTFTLDLDQVDYQVPELLGGKTGMIVGEKGLKDPKSLPTQPDGAGPFTLTSYVPDSHADMVRNAGYWDAKDIDLAKFTIQDITDQQQILAALESGQVNVAQIPGNLASAAKSAGFNIVSIPSEAVTEIDTQTTTAPFDDPKVVKAINYAINRQALAKVQTAGYATPAYQPFPKGYVGYVPAMANEYPYNPAKAKALLQQAGAAAHDPITLTNGLGPIYSSVVEQLQSQLEAVGLTVKIDTIPTDSFTAKEYVEKSLPFSIDGTAGRESPLEMLDVLYDQAGLMNVDAKAAKESTTVADALTDAQSLPLSSPKYGPALRKAVQTSVNDDGTHIWLYTTPRIFAVAKNVTGIPHDFVQQRWEGVKVGS